MEWRANCGGGREAAVHSGLALALGSHPCVALSSAASKTIVRQTRWRVKRSASILENKALNPGGLGAEPPGGLLAIPREPMGEEFGGLAIAEALVRALVVVKVEVVVERRE